MHYAEGQEELARGRWRILYGQHEQEVIRSKAEHAHDPGATLETRYSIRHSIRHSISGREGPYGSDSEVIASPILNLRRRGLCVRDTVLAVSQRSSVPYEYPYSDM